MHQVSYHSGNERYSYHTIPHPHHNISHHTMLYHTIPYHTIPYHTIPTSQHTSPYPHHIVPHPHHIVPYPHHSIPQYISKHSSTFGHCQTGFAFTLARLGIVEHQIPGYLMSLCVGWDGMGWGWGWGRVWGGLFFVVLTANDAFLCR